MKFNEVNKSTKETSPEITSSKSHNKMTQEHIIQSMYRYDNIGVYVMKDGKKGFFKDLASYINDGKTPTSWAIKVSNSDGWHIQFGINPQVDFLKNDIFLSDIISTFAEKFDGIKVDGTRKAVIISQIKDKSQAESIVNKLVSTFRLIDLDLSDESINPLFTLESSNTKFKIEGFYSDNSIDDESIKKFKTIIKKLSQVSMSKDDSITFNKIKNKKKFSQKEKLIIDQLMKDYLTTHDRVSIAMKYLDRSNK
jgi:hypothetical protein